MPVLTNTLANRPPAQFVNPYEAELEAYKRQLAELNAQPAASMFTPEQTATRERRANADEMLGLTALLSGDRAMGSVGEPLLKQALAQRTRRITDHGEYDPISGEFKMFPAYERMRRQEALERSIARAEGQSSAAQERWDRDRQRAADAEALRLLALENRREPQGPAGTFMYAGVDAEGKPILLHSTTGGLVQPNPQPGGPHIPYAGNIGPKPTVGSVEKSKMRDAAIAKADDVIKIAEQTPEAFSPSKGILLHYTPEVLKGAVGSRVFSARAQQVRGQIFAEAAVVVNNLIGAAQTDKERMGLQPFIPQPTDPPELIFNKLKAAREVAVRERAAMQGGASPGIPATGQITQPAVSGTQPTQPAPAPAPRIKLNERGERVP